LTGPSFYPCRAFISRSHRDQKWRDWLHTGLASFRIDPDPSGRVAAALPASNRLRAIFRDRGNRR
jgi:hypothetical protein